MVQGTVARAVLTIRETVHSTGSLRFRRRWLNWLQSLMASIGTTMIKISTPTSLTPCGTRVSAELATTSNKVASVSAARAGRNRPILRMWAKLMETATNSKPVSAAAAATITLKNGSQSARS
jgi:hypothetical protein